MRFKVTTKSNSFNKNQAKQVSKKRFLYSISTETMSRELYYCNLKVVK